MRLPGRCVLDRPARVPTPPHGNGRTMRPFLSRPRGKGRELVGTNAKGSALRRAELPTGSNLVDNSEPSYPQPADLPAVATFGVAAALLWPWITRFGVPPDSAGSRPGGTASRSVLRPSLLTLSALPSSRSPLCLSHAPLLHPSTRSTLCQPRTLQHPTLFSRKSLTPAALPSSCRHRFHAPQIQHTRCTFECRQILVEPDLTCLIHRGLWCRQIVDKSCS